MNGITIIIPAYNSQSTIDKCIQSIVGQTYKNWELIVVNDGSTDDTLLMAKSWAKKDKRIRVLSQNNQGSGPARNLGLKNAGGNYIMFIDPDDWICSTMLQVYYEKMEERSVDLIISNSVSDFYKDGQYTHSEYEPVTELYCSNIDETRKMYMDLFVEGLIRGPVCKLYKKDIIDENSIEFPSLRRSQDIVFNYRYYNRIKTFYLFDSNLYHYVREEKSQNIKIRKDYYKAISMIFSDIENMYMNWNICPDKKTKNIFCNYLYDALLFQLQVTDCSEIMKDIISDQGIRKLLKSTTPLSIKRIITKYLMLLKQVNVLNLCMRKYKVKNEIETQ